MAAALTGGALTLVAIPGAAAPTAALASTASPATVNVRLVGHAQLAASSPTGGEVRPSSLLDDPGTATKAVANRSPRSHALATRTTTTASGITGTSLGVASSPSGFNGINHYDQRYADGGNQWSTTPPDQGLCVGNGQVVETVNVAVRVYGTDGTPLTDTQALNPFFGFTHEADRSGPSIVASPDQIGDPSCVYDAGSNRFFLTVYDGISDTAGNMTGPSYVDIAVSPAGTALGTWNVYQLDTTNDGTDGTPTHPNCPCFADYPHIGTNANGFFITTNEFDTATLSTYNGSNVYAISKNKLVSGTATLPAQMWNTKRADGGEDAFTLAPALSNGTTYPTAANGTMYFMSTNPYPSSAPDGGPNNYVLVWSLTNTASINNSIPTLRLHHVRVGVDTFDIPPASDQKVGSVPLADCLNLAQCSKALLGQPDKYKESEFAFDSNDTRMLQSAFAAGKLWGAIDTAVDVGGKTKAGVAYYVLTPTSTSSSVSATLVKQQTLAVPGNNISYPALGVTSAGKGVIGMTLVGPDYFPSTGYVTVDATSAAPNFHISAAGLGPDDDFSGYKGYLYDHPRWGDYGAASVVGGTVWVANEFIGQTCTLAQYESSSPFGSCGGTRSALANWGTHVTHVTP